MAELIHTQELKESLLRTELEKIFRKGDSVAVKLHFGEKGNNTRLRPEFAKAVVDALKSIGAEPFLYDSSTVYPGPRDNPEGHRKLAEEHGYSEKTMGCRLFFDDDFKVVREKEMDVEVCSRLLDADGMIVLSHVKGHICTGMGGAIKNLGMGGVTKNSKGAIHGMSGAEYVSGCTGCRLCERICPFGSIKVKDNRPAIDSCSGCGQCVLNCPEGAFKVREYTFDLLISVGAHAVVKNMEKTYYINIMNDITKLCDCCNDPGEKIAPDAGMLMGPDPVAIDKASMDIINKKSGKEVFRIAHHKSPILHIKEAEKLGMGKMNYTLRKS
jgi:uncharacterized Fe-S center protein